LVCCRQIVRRYLESKRIATGTHNILASLFLRRKKKPIWTAKTIIETAKAVTKAYRVMPERAWAAPGV
jgi:hypothetical protein